MQYYFILFATYVCVWMNVHLMLHVIIVHCAWKMIRSRSRAINRGFKTTIQLK